MARPIAVQLYSLRAETATSLEAVLDRLATKGYVGVETANLGGLTGTAYRALLDRCGLVAASAHVGYEGRDAFRRQLEDHAALGTDTVVIPFAAPDEFKTIEGIDKVAQRLNRAQAISAEFGLALGYHNHFWEFAIQHDGRPALDHLFERLAPEVVAEIDVYWATVGGANPVDVLQAMGDRVTRLHVKDGPGTSHEEPMTAVGSGALPIADILAASASAQWHIVELDACATDMFEAVEHSHDFLVGSGLSQGRS